VSHLLESVEQSLRARGPFKRGQKILVAVSGGVDSMALLHVLHRLGKKNKWRLTVAHLNHRLRGAASDADERMVARAARKLKLPFVAESADVKRLAKTGGLSLEMAARKARHEFLARTAARLKIPSIALAHHADDQVELFFLRLLRGAGSDGMSGMKWRAPSPANPKIELVRPFLEQSKATLHEFARVEKISFREDASNEWADIQRNLIRRELLPLLRTRYQPALNRVVLRLMDLLGADAAALNDTARKWLEEKASKRKLNFADLPVALQRRCIQLELQRNGIPADFALIERLRTSPGRPFAVVPQVAVLRGMDGRLSFRNSAPVEANTDEAKFQLNGRAGEAFFGGRRIRWKIVSQTAFRLPARRSGEETFDADKIGPQIVLRHWWPGDRFHPIGMSQPVKLQDFFTNQKVPRARRHKLIVAVTGRNEVFWVESQRMSEQFKLTRQTKRRLIWQWKPG
jgi:tRNA(Ile)-lysidine synthase